MEKKQNNSSRGRSGLEHGRMENSRGSSTRLGYKAIRRESSRKGKEHNTTEHGRRENGLERQLESRLPIKKYTQLKRKSRRSAAPGREEAEPKVISESISEPVFANEKSAESADRQDSGESRIEGRNAVLEAFRSGRTVDRLYMLEDSVEGTMQSIRRAAAKAGTTIKYVSRLRLDQMSQTGKHQGVIAEMAAYHYSTLDDMFALAEKRGEDPFFIILDKIEDPHNLGAIIRTANVVGAHGVIIPKDRAVGLTTVVAKGSAGALNYTPVVKVTNIAATIQQLKQKGMWFVCADMDGTPMTKLNMTGPIGMVVGAEGEGVSRLVKENCDIVASIPMRGEINSLNASVAAAVLAYEIERQRDLSSRTSSH